MERDGKSQALIRTDDERQGVMAQSTTAIGIFDHGAAARAGGPNVHTADLPEPPSPATHTGVQDHIRTAVGAMDVWGNAAAAQRRCPTLRIGLSIQQMTALFSRCSAIVTAVVVGALPPIRYAHRETGSGQPSI